MILYSSDKFFLILTILNVLIWGIHMKNYPAVIGWIFSVFCILDHGLERKITSN